eukprot:g10030.t1
MRYTSNFKACVPITALELPLRSNLQIILKESGKGEQFNYTVDRLTTMISIAVLAVEPPGPVCAITLFFLQLVAFLNRFYTNYTSLSKAAKARAKKRKKLASRTAIDAFLEVEVFKLFMQALVLAFLVIGQLGLMPGPLCAIGCILTCVITMIEINKQIESLSESVTEFYRMYRSYQVQAMNWLNGENSWGIKFYEFQSLDTGGMESVNSVSFVVPELGLRLTGKTSVDDLLPQDEKMKQQLIKYTALPKSAPTGQAKATGAGYGAPPAAPSSLPSRPAPPAPGALPSKAPAAPKGVPGAPKALPKAEAKGRAAPPPPRALPGVGARAGPSDSGFSAPPPPASLPTAPSAPSRPAPGAPTGIPAAPSRRWGEDMSNRSNGGFFGTRSLERGWDHFLGMKSGLLLLVWGGFYRS